MEIQISRKFNYHAESVFLLLQLANGITTESILSTLRSKAFYSMREPDILKAISTLEALHDALKAAIDLDDDRLRLLFKNYPERDSALPLALVDIFVDFFAAELTPKRGCSQFSAIVGFMDDPNTRPDVCDENSLHEYIFSLDVIEPLKYSLIYCFYRFEPLQTYALDLLRKASSIIEPILSEIEGGISEYLQAISGMEPDLFGFFEKNFNVKLDTNTRYLIYPCFSNFSSLYIVSDWYSDDLYISIGCFSIGNKDYMNLAPEHLAMLLKALSDETKLKILQMLKAEPLYSAQIAERLSLTPATISHHTTALTGLSLLNLEKVNNRVYFSLQTETLRRMLSELEALLL